MSQLYCSRDLHPKPDFQGTLSRALHNLVIIYHPASLPATPHYMQPRGGRARPATISPFHMRTCCSLCPECLFSTAWTSGCDFQDRVQMLLLCVCDISIYFPCEKSPPRLHAHSLCAPLHYHILALHYNYDCVSSRPNSAPGGGGGSEHWGEGRVRLTEECSGYVEKRISPEHKRNEKVHMGSWFPYY